MEWPLPLLLSLVALSFPSALATVEQPEVTFEQLYQFGKNAYTEGNWQDCISFMRRALEDFEYMESELSACAGGCISRVSAPCASSLCPLFYSSQLALCILRCRQYRLTERRPSLSKRATLYDFLDRQPFRYLQLCYWKDGNLEMAVKSAYTFLVANAGDKEMIDNLNFYMQQQEFAEHMLTDLLRADYEKMFISGVDAYTAGDWDKCISDLEAALEEFWKEEGRCRLGCRYNVDWATIETDSDIDFVISRMAGSVLRCQHHCLSRLSWVNGHDFHHLPARIYEYTHLCYFNVKRGQDAIRATANFLLFDNHPSMRWNRHYYTQTYANSQNGELFHPHPKVLEQARKRILEKRTLDFIDNRMRLTNGDLPPEQADDYNVMVEETDLNDSFPYGHVEMLLDAELCLGLRSPLPLPHSASAVAEAERRVAALFGSAGEARVECGGERDAHCARPVVLSIEKDKCSQWLPSRHHSCVLLFCQQSHS